MAKFIISLDNDTVSEHQVDKACLTIGRHKDNDIYLNDRTVSTHHAQIITILNDSFIEDLNSTNGTLINSTAVKKHALVDGDKLKLGKYRLKYIKHRAQT